MKIFTAPQIRLADTYTIQNEPISSFLLMERAANMCTNWFVENCSMQSKIIIICGNGNNGGDGFAIARLLYAKGFFVNVFVSGVDSTFSNDAKINLALLKELPNITINHFEKIFETDFNEKTIIIDALFGTGLSRKLDDYYAELIRFLNLQKCTKISIDVPSGMFIDKILENNQVIFKADYTLSFQFWKRAFLHPETGVFAGKIVILDINLSKDFIEETNTNFYTIDEDYIHSIYKKREEFSHKGTYGKAIIVGGGYGKIGAAVLATKSALRSGSGLTFVCAPNCGYDILQISCPEAMFIYGGDNEISVIDIDDSKTYGIGPGMGTDEQTKVALVEFLSSSTKPVILDADALNILSSRIENLLLIPGNSILTPHPKEFERLFGKTKNSFERLELAIKKSKEYNFIIVLKDHHTQIVTPNGKVYYNITGNAGLAKGGSGDILTGILTSLLAQGYSFEEACILGVWLHGKASDFSAMKYSQESMLPSDVINELGSVFKYLNKKTTT